MTMKRYIKLDSYLENVLKFFYEAGVNRGLMIANNRGMVPPVEPVDTLEVEEYFEEFLDKDTEEGSLKEFLAGMKLVKEV